MEVLIIEDEYLSAERLRKQLQQLNSSVKVLAVIDSVEDAVRWFSNNPLPELVLMDIHLADGSSFEIFEQAQLDVPVIFTTAYDKYAIKAFKVNSVDYLLKPIDANELAKALEKFRQLNSRHSSDDIKAILSSFNKSYKSRFIVKSGTTIIAVPTEEVAYFYSEDKLTFIKTRQGKKYIIDYSLDSLLTLLAPDRFFRINRKVIVAIDAIEKINTYVNNRLLLEVQPPYHDSLIVSREKVSDFKQWLDG